MKKYSKGPDDSTVSKAFVLHMAYLGSTFSIPYGPLSPSGIISQYRARSNPRALPGVVQKQTKYKKLGVLIWRRG